MANVGGDPRQLRLKTNFDAVVDLVAQQVPDAVALEESFAPTPVSRSPSGRRAASCRRMREAVAS
jgi:hypothetical protein